MKRLEEGKKGSIFILEFDGEIYMPVCASSRRLGSLNGMHRLFLLVCTGCITPKKFLREMEAVSCLGMFS